MTKDRPVYVLSLVIYNVYWPSIGNLYYYWSITMYIGLSLLNFYRQYNLLLVTPSKLAFEIFGARIIRNIKKHQRHRTCFLIKTLPKTLFEAIKEGADQNNKLLSSYIKTSHISLLHFI